jgi:histone-lysine N-methyltransferase SETD3
MDLSGDSDRDKFTKSIKPKSKSDAPDKYDVFLKWLVDNGTKFPKLELVDYGDEVRGCHAKNNVNAEEILVEVPLSCLITVEMGKETPIGKAIMASNIELDAPKHIFLMVYMLIDMKNTNSFFKPYYNILPTNLSNMPIFWTDEELALLEGSYMLQQIEERKKAIENDYKLIKSIYPNLVDLCNLKGT